MAGEGSAAGGSNQASRNPNLWQQPGPTSQVSPWDQASCSPPGAEPWGAMRPPCAPRGQGPPPQNTAGPEEPKAHWWGGVGVAVERSLGWGLVWEGAPKT